MKNKYSFSEFVSTSIAYIFTKLFYRPARLFRRPIYIRGKKSMSIGKNMTLGHSCRFDLNGVKESLFIGANCEFGDNTHIVALNDVRIGNNVLVASKVFISDTNHGIYKGINQDPPFSCPNQRNLVSETVKIGNNVWIGENVVILAGSIIGDGCIVGANSVLKGIYLPNTIIVGSPGRIIKKWDESKNEWIRV